MTTFNTNIDSEFVSSCIEAGFTASDATDAWNKAIADGVNGMMMLAHKMIDHAASIGGSDDKARKCAMASSIVMRELREMMAA